jgi:uncharacterized protein YbjQ (UPF0145 family)
MDAGLFGLIVQLAFFIIPLVLFYAVGAFVEKRHYESITSREKRLIKIPVVNLKKNPSPERKIKKSHLVQGSAVISLDYFKRFVASLRCLVGGRILVYESLLDRARREAILRLKESCPKADIVVNIRLENSAIAKSSEKNKQVGAIEVLAYGTAIYYE